MDFENGENLHRRAVLGKSKGIGIYPSDNTNSDVGTTWGSTSHQIIDKYIKMGMAQWQTNPELDHIFKKQKWKQWIRQTARKENESHKFSSDAFLDSFAINLIANFIDERYEYFKTAKRVLDVDQARILEQLKKNYEAEEEMKLMALANGEPVLQEGDNGDSIWVTGRKLSPLKPNNVSPNSPKRRRDESSSDLFVDVPGAWQTQNSSKLNTRKRYRVNNAGARLSIVFARRPKKKVQKETADADPNMPQINEENSKDAECICVESQGDVSFFEKSAIFEDSQTFAPQDGDVFIENATPPRSPFDIRISVDKEPLQRNNRDAEKAVCATPTSCSDTANNSPDRKLSCSYGQQTVQTPESKSNENRRRIRIRPTAVAGPVISPKVHNESAKEVNVPELEAPVDQDKENYPATMDEIAMKYPKPPSAPPLTLDMFHAMREALKKPPKEKVVTGFSLHLLQEELALFHNEDEWLNDRNIDFYLELIKDRSKQEGYPSVYIFHSFFYTLLTETDGGGYEAVRDTTGEDNIFEYDIVFFPINLSQHWRLVEVKFAKKTLLCYDSMDHKNSSVLRSIAKYLMNEYKRKYGNNNVEKSVAEVTTDNDTTLPILVPESTEGEIIPCERFFDSNDWTVLNMPSTDIPQQKNAIDCGVFVLQYAEYLSRRQEFDFDQDHVSYFRQRMLYETLTKQLLTSLPLGSDEKTQESGAEPKMNLIEMKT